MRERPGKYLFAFIETKLLLKFTSSTKKFHICNYKYN